MTDDKPEAGWWGWLSPACPRPAPWAKGRYVDVDKPIGTGSRTLSGWAMHLDVPVDLLAVKLKGVPDDRGWIYDDGPIRGPVEQFFYEDDVRKACGDLLDSR